MTRAEERQRNRETILRAAIDIVMTRGIDSASIAEIAEASGLTAMSVYRYFGSKQAIIVSVANARLKDYLDEHMRRCEAEKTPNESGFDAFSRIVFAYIDTFKAHPEYVRFLQEMTAYSLREGLTDEVEYLHFGVQGSHLQKPAFEALQRGVADGSVRDEIDLLAVSRTLTNLLTGGVHYCMMIDESTQFDILRETARMIVYYVRKKEKEK